MASRVFAILLGGAVVTASAVTWAIVRSKRSVGSKNRLDAEFDGIKRVKLLEINPLSAGDRDRFADRWRMTQAAFEDNPAIAVSEASTLVEEVMQARGYPVSEFTQRSAEFSAEHPQFVANYREAREVALAYQRGAARAEDLQRVTIHYQALFADLLATNKRNDGI
jgi:hypothetical protein